MRYVTLCLAVALCVGAAFKGPGPRTKVGVVDLNAIFSKSSKWADIQAFLSQRKKERQEEIKQLELEIQNLQAELTADESTSSNQKKLQAKLLKKKAYLRATRRQYKIEQDRTDLSHYQGFISEVDRVIADLAEERGLDLVLQRSLDTSEGFWRSVLYAAPRTDLTDEAIARLNSEHRSVK